MLYAQPWLRAAQVIRAGLPAVVTRRFRDQLPRLERHDDYEDSGLIGKGAERRFVERVGD